jgi:fluoride exporter
MKQFALVALGGALGAVSRWKLGGMILHATADWTFPLSTFVVNAVGCVVAGTLAGLTIKHQLLTPDAALFLLTGLLGGFTTFSAFGLETALLLRRGHYGMAIWYVVASLGAGLTGLCLAMWIIPHQKPN